MKMIRISAIWCTSCLITYQTWKKIQEEYKDFEYIEYDYDTDSEVQEFNIGTIIPAIIILDNDNKEITRIIGEKSQKDIKKVIDEVINNI